MKFVGAGFGIKHMMILFVLICILMTASNIIGERAKRARHYQGCTNSSWCGIYIYMYGGTYAIIVAHATYTPRIHNVGGVRP